MENLDWVVEVLNKYLRGGRLPTECTWKMVVLVPKGNGKFRGIGIVEVYWMLMSGVVNQRIRGEVQFHDIMHGFWSVQVTGTASLEAKLLQQLT